MFNNLLKKQREKKVTKQENTQEQSAPSPKSYIDEETGKIFLRSFRYKIQGDEEWIVSNDSILIIAKKSKSVSISFSEVQMLKIEPHQELGIDINLLSFETFQEYIYDPSGDGSWGTEQRIELRPFAQIAFRDSDIEIAKAICDRIIVK
jgi:hypothetical protein